MLMRFLFTHFLILFYALAAPSISHASISDFRLTKEENAIFSLNLVLTENVEHSTFHPDYRKKKLQEVTFQNGQWLNSSNIEYDQDGYVIRLERREKNRRGESVTKIYKDNNNEWVKCIKWLINGKESNVGKTEIRYQQDSQGRILYSALMNSDWVREYVYNDDEQLIEVIERRQVGNRSEDKYTVKKYYYNSQGFMSRRDLLTGQNSFMSTLYFDYNENNMLRRIVSEAIAYSTNKNRSERFYSSHDKNNNWLQAEWVTQDNKFKQNRKIVYY